MKILYGKFESEKVSATCYAHTDNDSIYLYEILIVDKELDYGAYITPKTLEDGGFEIIVELLKRGRSIKETKRVFEFIHDRHLVKKIGKGVILKSRLNSKEQVMAYLARKYRIRGEEKVTDYFGEKYIEDILEVIAGSTLK